MQKRKIDELISYFNRKVADMDIDREYKMELLGMITAIGIACEKELSNEPECKTVGDEEWTKVRGGWSPQPERKIGKWIDDYEFVCSVCGFECDDPYYLGSANYCPSCGAKMEVEHETD